MRLADAYSINVRYQRATRIDNDLSTDFFPGLVFHGTAENTLRTLGKQFAEARQHTFTVTGPYGTGKSTIALLLTGFLHHDQIFRNAAKFCMKETFSGELSSYFPVEKGWLIVRAVSGVENPLLTIWKAIHFALADHPATCDLADKYALPKEPVTEAALEKLVIGLFKDVSGKVDGVYFMLDEMGKTLEYFLKRDLDIQFFQTFAESFQRSPIPAIFIGFLHQAFSEYASARGKSVQEQWGKIQGRYSDLLYGVSADETVALIAQSIQNKSQRPETWHVNLVKKVCDSLQWEKLRESAILHDRLQECFPLHPSVALLLGPISKRSFSQNERSTFSFLNSREPNSFHDFLSENSSGSHASYQLHHLWDYLESNLEHRIAGSSEGHAWSIAQEAISRTRGNHGETHRQIIKTIAILNLFGRHIGMYATAKAVSASMGHITTDELEDCLAELKRDSIIIFRKHLSAWAVFEGSDFDLEQALELQRDTLQFDDGWVEVLEHSHQFSISKRHYHKKGTLRWMDQCIALNMKSVKKQNNGAFASFVLLTEDYGDSKHFKKLSEENPSCAIGTGKDINPLREAARELLALQRIEKDTPEIQHDRIAMQEIESRTLNIRREIDDAHQKAFDNATWWFRGEQLPKGSLHMIASQIADRVYPCTPEIFNELINREKPSGTSNAARRKLMEQMVEFAGEENLGLNDGFPPEKAIYLSCLKQTGLHDQIEKGTYGFVIPDRSGTESLQKMLVATQKWINISSDKITLQEIYDFWKSEPYGVTAGISPILALAYLLSRDEDLAYYDKDSTGQFIFIPEIDDEFINKMMRAPKEIAVRYFEVSGVKHHYIHTFAKIAGNKLNREITPQALNIARPIVTFVHQLPAWVKSARLADGPAKKFRDAVMKANDPYRLLLEDLYTVFGMDAVRSEAASDKLLDDTLNSAIDQLRSMHVEMLNGYKKILTAELGELNDDLVERCNRVHEVAADFRLQAFSQRLGKCTTADDRWLESLIALVANAPAKDWNDTTLAKGREELFEYCQRFKRIQTFAAAGEQDRVSGSKSIALIIGTDDGAQEYVRQVTVSEKQVEEVRELKAKLIEILKKSDVDDLKALALQEALQDILSPYEMPVCALEGV